MALKQDGRDLLAHFRRLAPERRLIGIQRWSVRWVLLTLGVLVASVFALTQAINLLAPVQEVPISRAAECGTGSTLLLMAQAVPSAESVPCIQLLPAGWRFDVANVHDGRAKFSLDNDRVGNKAVTVTLSPECDLSGRDQIGMDEEGLVRYQDRAGPGPRPALVRHYLFQGGCATYRYSPAAAASPTIVVEAQSGLTFMPRQALVDHVERDLNQVLCGRAGRCEP